MAILWDMGSMLGIALAVTLAQATPEQLQQQVDQLQAQVNALQGQLAENQAAAKARAARAEDLQQVHVALGQLWDELRAGSSDISDAQGAAIAQFQAVSASAHASGSEREAFFADDAIRTLQQISEALDRQGYLDAKLLLARAMWDANQGREAALSQ